MRVADIMRSAAAGMGALLLAAPVVATQSEVYPSTYAAMPSVPTVLRNASLYDGAGGFQARTDILLVDGKVAGVGQGLTAPVGAREIDATGRFVTPGLIDVHSHLGVYPAPGLDAHSDGNEAVRPNTADVWAEHSVWPQDPGFDRALAGGVTTLQILPGSANLFGCRSVILKNLVGRSVQDMKFPGARYGLKMACGENPKRVYGDQGGPSTRMGNVAGYRIEFEKAVGYKRKWDEYDQKLRAYEETRGRRRPERPTPPDVDLRLETLKGVLEGSILPQIHCYRADEMVIMLDLAREFGFRIRQFHHAVESYKIADLLAREEVCSAVWADWWGFKIEAYDTVRENASLIDQAGACAVIHSDSAVGIQRLNQELAKTWADGVNAGIVIEKARAWRWLGINAARSIGLEDRIGSVEVGKNADVVVWSRDPFSVYAQADLVFIDGAVAFDRSDPARRPRGDFETGLDLGVGR
jgi:imidazolonepropionase-like amidohydrolase